MEDQALHIVGEVDEHDLGFGALDSDGANECSGMIRGIIVANHMCAFSCAKTCSTKTRTFDLALLALRVWSGIGLPLGFLRWMRLTLQLALSHASLLLER
jgi:hypothetical protein